MRIATGLIALSLSACGGDPEPVLPVVDHVGLALHEDVGSFVHVTWQQREAANDTWIEYQVDGEEAWRRTPSATAAVGMNKALVVGIPFDTDFTARVVNDFGSGVENSDPVSGSTGKVPRNLPEPRLDVSEDSSWQEGDNYLLGSINQEGGGWSGGTFWKWIVDREGRYIWASRTKNGAWSIFLRLSVDGTHILWDDATYWSDFDNGADSKVHRMYLDGTTLQTHDTPGLHHAFTELPDGSLLYGSAGWYDEVLIEQAPDGTERTIFDCVSHLDAIGYDGPYGSYCQSNTLYYHEPTDSILYSFYTNSSVLEIDRATGDVTRLFGNLPGSYAFADPDTQFWFQHGAAYTDSGTLLLSSHQSYYDYTGVLREFEVDDTNETLVEVWNQGLDGDIDSPTAGEAHRLNNGNTIHNYGASPVVQEVTPDGTVVWQVTWGSKDHLIGRTVFMDDLYSYVQWPASFEDPDATIPVTTTGSGSTATE